MILVGFFGRGCFCCFLIAAVGVKNTVLCMYFVEW